MKTKAGTVWLLCGIAGSALFVRPAALARNSVSAQPVYRSRDTNARPAFAARESGQEAAMTLVSDRQHAARSPDETPQTPDTVSRPRESPTPYPGLPDLDLQTMRNPETRQKILAATSVAVQKELWPQHLDAVEKTLLHLTNVRTSFTQQQALERLLDHELTTLLLLQAAGISKIGPETLQISARQESGAEFLEWFMTSPAAMVSYLSSIAPEDSQPDVLRLWAELWKEDPQGRQKYNSLALACALVYDQPRSSSGQTADIRERYMNFRIASDKGQLKTELDKLPASELVWVVDISLPATELEWARKRVGLKRESWHKAYRMVRYRMDKVVKGKNIHDVYNLENILKEGGICTDQAYFAAATAKANGIPAMAIVGEGERGGHAWFGYKESRDGWNLDAGRYEDDKLAAGKTMNPQTGKKMNEHDLRLMADVQRLSPQYEWASKMVWLAQILIRHNDLEKARLALELALKARSRHVEAWLSYVDLLMRQDVELTDLRRTLGGMRTAFKDYPDMIARVDLLETEALQAKEGAQAAADFMARSRDKMEDRGGNRTDLAVRGVLQQVALLANAGKISEAKKLYRDSLREYGKDVVPFKQLARAYFGFGQEHKMQKDALDEIESTFKRYHDKPNLADYFEAKNHAELIRMVASFYEQCGEERKAERLRSDADGIEERANRKEQWSR